MASLRGHIISPWVEHTLAAKLPPALWCWGVRHQAPPHSMLPLACKDVLPWPVSSPDPSTASPLLAPFPTLTNGASQGILFWKKCDCQNQSQLDRIFWNIAKFSQLNNNVGMGQTIGVMNWHFGHHGSGDKDLLNHFPFQPIFRHSILIPFF